MPHAHQTTVLYAKRVLLTHISMVTQSAVRVQETQLMSKATLIRYVFLALQFVLVALPMVMDSFA